MNTCPRLNEFFQDELGHYSMTRLLCFFSFWPASWVLIKNPTEGLMGWYLGAYAGAYALGKFADAAMKPKDGAVNTTVNVEKVNVGSNPATP